MISALSLLQDQSFCFVFSRVLFSLYFVVQYIVFCSVPNILNRREIKTEFNILVAGELYFYLISRYISLLLALLT